jgi:DNA-binding PadR family transcriptional regulator
MQLPPPDSREMPPLSPAVFHILLALADGEMHGYAIMSHVESSTNGGIKIGPGTLYGNIKKLLADKLIHETDQRPDPDMDDERRRYYGLTAAGAQVLNAELERMRKALRLARGKKFIQPAGATA